MNISCVSTGRLDTRTFLGFSYVCISLNVRWYIALFDDSFQLFDENDTQNCSFDLLQKWGSEQVMNVSCLKEMFNNHFSQTDINFFYWHLSIEHNWILFKSEQSREKDAILWNHRKYQIGVDIEFVIDLAQIQNLLLSYCNIFCCFCCFCYVL